MGLIINNCISAVKFMSEKKYLTMVLLSIFLGSLGIHRMYAGKVGSGIIMMILSCSFFFIWVSAIWALIDMITVITGNFKDNKGLYIKNQ